MGSAVEALDCAEGVCFEALLFLEVVLCALEPLDPAGFEKLASSLSSRAFSCVYTEGRLNYVRVQLRPLVQSAAARLLTIPLLHATIFTFSSSLRLASALLSIILCLLSASR